MYAMVLATVATRKRQSQLEIAKYCGQVTHTHIALRLCCNTHFHYMVFQFMVWMLFFQLTPFPSLHHKRLLSVFYSEFYIHGILKFNVKICDAQVKLNLYRRWIRRWLGTWHRTWHGIWHGRWHFQNFQLSLILNMKNLQRSNANMFWLHWHHDYRWTSAKHHFLPHYIMHTLICLLQE